MIKLKSNKELMFPPYLRGFVTMDMDIIQNKPNEKVYEMRIVDSCSQKVMKDFEEPVLNEDGKPTFEEDGTPITTTIQREVEVQVGTPVTRFKYMSYDELGQLAVALNVDMSDPANLVENIQELFRQGFLIITNKEAAEGVGMYYSEPGDFSIVRPQVEESQETSD